MENEIVMIETPLVVSPYGFSAVRIDDSLGASEYTLVSIAQDFSISVGGFKKEMEKCLKEIIAACVKSKRCDNLMLRLQGFNSSLIEVHGFKPLGDCNQSDYDDCINIGGATALYDATENAVEALGIYGQDLVDNEYDVNAILIVITDGDDNSSTNTIDQIKQAFQKINKSEAIESIVSILVGVNVDSDIDQLLQNFKDDVGFDQYVGVDNADAKTLAKIANFVSSSISSQSRALEDGGTSKLLTF